MQTKLCRHCGEQKSKQNSGGWKCKRCDRERAAKFRAENGDLVREQRTASAKRRRNDPAGLAKIKATAKKTYQKCGAEYQQKRYAKMRAEQPFVWRSLLFRKKNKAITPKVLEKLWKAQKGRCAYTNRVLNVTTAHLDHKVAIAKGGSHDIGNLQWTCPEANYAKRDLSEAEFIQLCRDVVAHVG